MSVLYNIKLVSLIIKLHYPYLCCCVAEMYHFQHERVVDFREMMKLFLAEQIKFYQEVSIISVLIPVRIIVIYCVIF